MGIDFRKTWRNLQVLNLGHNRLASLEGIGGCRQLQALVANDNLISSLDGLEARSLARYYLT